MSKKVAIVTGNEMYDSHLEESKFFIESITDWVDVTEEEYNILNAARYTYNYRIVVRPIDTKQVVVETIAEYLEKIKQDEEKKKVEKEKRRLASEAKLVVTREQKLKELARLKKELGEE